MKNQENILVEEVCMNSSDMPMDFWNYDINPILGYRYVPQLHKRK